MKSASTNKSVCVYVCVFIWEIEWTNTDLAEDVDDISPLEGQLIGSISFAVPQALVIISIIRRRFI